MFAENVVVETKIPLGLYIGDSTFEKMGELMAQNNGSLFGLYDELSSYKLICTEVKG